MCQGYFKIVLVITVSVTIKLYVVFVEENKTGLDLNGRNVTMIITLTVSP